MNKDSISSNKLSKECNVFCYYLIKQMPNKYIIGKYHNAHRIGSIRQKEMSSFDKLLIGIALINPFFTKLVDVYTSIFFKSSFLKKKLILLLAILESCAPTCYYLDTVTSTNKTIIFFRFFQKTVLFALSLFLSTIIFTPLRVLFHRGDRNG